MVNLGKESCLHHWILRRRSSCLGRLSGKEFRSSCSVNIRCNK